MAAPTRPTPGDVRIPCPLCGGLIHPIAGRCKHCKQDLSTIRGARPAAASALPPLVAPSPGAPAPAPVPAPPPPATSNGHYAPNGHNPYAPPAMPAAAPQPPVVAPVANGVHEAQPILPPRPTGRMVTAPPVAGWWKSWPMIVIVLAGIAIVIAVVLMVWPPGGGDKGTQTVEPPPAPERMDTNPLPPKSGSITPSPSPSPPKPADPTAPAPPKVDIPDDPDPQLALGTPTQVAILDRVCDRLMVCGNDAAETFCDAAKELTRALGKRPGAPACDAGKRCMARIDRVDCAASAVDVQRLIGDPDCAEAMTKC
jgi:hypothetical protein